jgi:hypothetical protein
VHAHNQHNNNIGSIFSNSSKINTTDYWLLTGGSNIRNSHDATCIHTINKPNTSTIKTKQIERFRDRLNQRQHTSQIRSSTSTKQQWLQPDISSKHILTSFKSSVNRVETLDTNAIQVAKEGWQHRRRMNQRQHTSQVQRASTSTKQQWLQLDISSKNILTSFKSSVNRVETLDTNVIQVAKGGWPQQRRMENVAETVSTCQLFGEERIGGCGCRSKSFSCWGDDTSTMRWK